MSERSELFDAAMKIQQRMLDFGYLVNDTHISRELYESIAEHISQTNRHLSRLVHALDGPDEAC